VFGAESAGEPPAATRFDPPLGTPGHLVTLLACYPPAALYPASGPSGEFSVSDRPDPLTPPTATTAKPYALLALLQVHWFIRLRWIFVVAALAALAIERFAMPTAQRPWSLLAVVLAVAAINVAWAALTRLLRPQLENPGPDQRLAIRHGQAFVSAQIAIDLLLLTWILALTGGVENPMSLFYLFHVAISGLLLRTWQACLQGIWAVLLYGGMCLAQSRGWLAYYPFLPQLGPSGLHALPTYTAIAVAVNALAIFGTLYFTDRISRVLDRREDLLIRTNAALEQSRQAIQELQRRRSRFMQTAAHQLKSPLAMVQTLASLIRDGLVKDPPAVQATCEKIARRCHEGISQVTELLTLARVQEADPRRHREAVSDVGQVVAEICAHHAPVAGQKHIDFTWHIPERTALLAHVHRADLGDCVSNLVDNAIKYTPDGGSVQVNAISGRSPPAGHELPAPPRAADRPVTDYVFVIVKDTGIGLGDAAEFLMDSGLATGSIFDAFRRGDAAVAAGIPGTGLGLSIVREVLGQCGGYIHVRSKRGVGSTFTVSFPAAAPQQESATASPGVEQAA
jgi:signal transduction histidine kinase